MDRFAEVLEDAIRADDAICRIEERRLVVLLVDSDLDGARGRVHRVHRRMGKEALAFRGGQPVRPKALYRLSRSSRGSSTARTGTRRT